MKIILSQPIHATPLHKVGSECTIKLYLERHFFVVGNLPQESQRYAILHVIGVDECGFRSASQRFMLCTTLCLLMMTRSWYMFLLLLSCPWSSACLRGNGGVWHIRRRRG